MAGRATIDRIHGYLHTLSVAIGSRPAGSAANREATAYLERELREAGATVERQAFACLDWRGGETTIGIAGSTVPATTSPWSLGCELEAELVPIATLEELEQTPLEGRVALCYGDLAREPLMPKNFPFYNPDRHRAIVKALERAKPAALLAVSSSPTVTLSLVEDGDLELPAATVAQAYAATLLAARGPIRLRIDGERRPGSGANLIARWNREAVERVVVTAHLDTKPGTPGALDNASGVAALLALAETLGDLPAERGVELALLNGEDHYAAPGQRRYLAGAELRDVRLAINCDGVGLAGSPVGVAPMGMAEDLSAEVARLRRGYPGLAPLAPWPQGDHMLFLAAGVPVLALTSAGIFELLETVVHTADDLPDRVDPGRIAETAAFVRQAVML